MKIAVYSCSFGEYRNELKNGIDNNLIFDSSIDYYFFTDATYLKSKFWKIMVQPLIQSDTIMNGFRWTSKYIKFMEQTILKEYDILVWCDTKLIVQNSVLLNRKKIEKLYNDKPYKLYNVYHFDRRTPQQEVYRSIKLKLENKENGKNFLNEIKDIKYDTSLVDTCLIIRKNDEITNALFEHIYTLLYIKGLQRDQNVYNHAIHECMYPTEFISYLHFRWLMFD